MSFYEIKIGCYIILLIIGSLKNYKKLTSLLVVLTTLKQWEILFFSIALSSCIEYGIIWGVIWTTKYNIDYV